MGIENGSGLHKWTIHTVNNYGYSHMKQVYCVSDVPRIKLQSMYILNSLQYNFASLIENWSSIIATD